MSAFGSYAKMEQPIDFTVPSQNLFLITGDTGSGKTTIFDAMIFALYGDVSAEAALGKKKKDKNDKVKMMQSQFAKSGEIPTVVLRFIKDEYHADEIYEIRRTAEYQRPQKGKREGVCLEAGSVSLLMPGGIPYTEKNVNEKIEEIVGLSGKQFMQVAMIAQGDFMQLLRAPSAEKVLIFRKLFGTEIYERIESKLNEKRKLLLLEEAQLKEAIAQEALHAKTIENMEDEKRLEKLTNSFSNTSLQLEEFFDLLTKIQKNEQESLVLIEEKKNETEKKQASLIEKLSIAKELISQFEQLEQANVELFVLKERENDFQAKMKELSDARNAERIVPTEMVLQRLNKEQVDCAALIKTATEQLPDALENQQKQEEQFQQVDLSLQKINQEYGEISEKVESALSDFDALEKVEQEKSKKEAEQKEILLQKESLENKATSLEKVLHQKEDFCKANENCALDYERKNQQYELCKEKASKRLEMTEQLERLTNQRTEMEGAKSRYLSSQAEYQKADDLLSDMNRRYFDAQAGILQKQLKEGTPCMVCGSTKWHLELVQYDLENIPTKDKLDLQSNNREQSLKMMQECSENAGIKKSSFDHTFQILKDSIQNKYQFDFTDDSTGRELLSKSQKQEEQEEKVIEKERKEAQLLLFNYQDTLIEIQKIQKQLENNKNEEKQLEESIQALNQSLAALLDREQELSRRLQFQNKVEAIQTRENALKKKTEAAKVQSDEKKILDEVQSMVHTLLHTKDTEQKRNQKLEADRLEQTERFQELLMEMDFHDSQSYVLAKRNHEQILALTKDTEEFQKQKIEWSNALKMSEASIHGREKPKIESLSEKLKLCQEQQLQLMNEIDQRKPIVHQNKVVLSHMKQFIKEENQLTQKMKSIQKLCDVANGKVFGGKTTLETYVLRMYMSDVLRAANRRLLQMSNEQYELIMKPLEQVGDKKNEGLDLNVHALVTDSYRDVKTLSGGESFMAALSLALGLADVIQASSHFVSLDIMFIDEGFGALDDNARAQAVNILKELAGGNKLIGIISHVTELKTLIDDKLLVEKKVDGSHARWES